jgi:hypothetical protein
MRKHKVARKTALAAIRGSVPDAKLRGARILLSDAPMGTQPIGGFTEYDRSKGGGVVKLGAPAGDSAYDITVRGHETAHATHDKARRKKPVTPNEALAEQIVGDVINESWELPALSRELMRQYKRAHMATAIKGDVRSILRAQRRVKAGLMQDTVALRNANLLSAVRAIGMLRSYSQDDYSLETKREEQMLKLGAAIGHKMAKAARLVASIASNPRRRNKAIGLLVSLMETEPPHEYEGETIEGDGDILEPVTEGDALDGHMRIVNLVPKSVYCAKEKQITRRHSPSGVIINPNRYVSAIVSGDANGLFARRIKQKAGGCVLIDASGSMGASKENLSAICKLVPTATLGYYSGYDNRGRGDLCVYADKGKRFNGELSNMYGGNAIDLPAIRWMMKHPRPWILVSDLQFCGGVMGSETVAHALVERAIRRGMLTVYRSLDEAYEAFGGKGNMPN